MLEGDALPTPAPGESAGAAPAHREGPVCSGCHRKWNGSIGRGGPATWVSPHWASATNYSLPAPPVNSTSWSRAPQCKAMNMNGGPMKLISELETAHGVWVRKRDGKCGLRTSGHMRIAGSSLHTQAPGPCPRRLRQPAVGPTVTLERILKFRSGRTEATCVVPSWKQPPEVRSPKPLQQSGVSLPRTLRWLFRVLRPSGWLPFSRT